MAWNIWAFTGTGKIRLLDNVNAERDVIQEEDEEIA